MRILIAVLLTTLGALTHAAEVLPIDTLAEQLKAGSAPPIIDVRTTAEYQRDHLPGARLIPHTEIGNRLQELNISPEQPVVLYCKSGRRANLAATTLEHAGFSNVQILDGSIDAWRAAGQALVQPSSAPGAQHSSE